jgi:hypothetical protein
MKTSVIRLLGVDVALVAYGMLPTGGRSQQAYSKLSK